MTDQEMIDRLTICGIIEWTDDKENHGTWAGYLILGTCLRLTNEFRWSSKLQEYRNEWYICTVGYTIVLKTLYSLTDFPSEAQLQKLHKEGLEANERFSQTPDF